MGAVALACEPAVAIALVAGEVGLILGPEVAVGQGNQLLAVGADEGVDLVGLVDGTVVIVVDAVRRVDIARQALVDLPADAPGPEDPAEGGAYCRVSVGACPATPTGRATFTA